MILYPKKYLKSVIDITIEFLEKNSIQGLILDVDNTLLDYYKNIPNGIEEWTDYIKNNRIRCCILSNTNKKEKVEFIAKKLNLPYVYFAKKPFKSGFLKSKNILGLECSNIAVVGDQIFTDVIGANRCKMYSILVDPISEKDILMTRIKRPIEKFVIKQYVKHNKTKEK